MKRHNRGNILFLILLAVILFAALSYAVTSSLRGGGNDVTAEAARTAAAEIINYSSQMENIILRMRVSGNCKLSEISFENSVDSSYAPHNSPRADKSCNVFDVNGGGMSWKTVPANWMASTTEAAGYSQTNYPTDYQTFNFPRNVCVRGITASTCLNNLATEKTLLIGLKYLKREICDAINSQFGFTTNTVAGNCNPAGDNARYLGIFGTGTYDCGGGSSGRRTGCYFSTRTGYTFWHILEAQ